MSKFLTHDHGKQEISPVFGNLTDTIGHIKSYYRGHIAVQTMILPNFISISSFNLHRLQNLDPHEALTVHPILFLQDSDLTQIIPLFPLIRLTQHELEQTFIFILHKFVRLNTVTKFLIRILVWFIL